MKKQILLGFEIKTGKEILIEPSHLIVTGLTQKAGKTTTLESLIKRSGRRAIVFRTKIGEKSFLSGTIIPPYFKDRSDWQFIQGLVEATIKEKLRSFERAKIIQMCERTGGNSLLEFKKKLDERYLEKMSGFEKDILTNLRAYLEIVLPKLQSIKFSNELELVEGLNIIDLERFSRDSEVQSLIIRSVLEEVLYNFKDVIIVLPEAWKFIPQERGDPCKRIVDEFIRQGATNGNYIWIDAQNITAVDKEPLKQVSEWIMGYQSEENEVKKTLSQIPLPKKSKPKPEDIMNLGTGMFYLATREKTIKVYVLPFWLDVERGKKVALGKIKIEDLDAPETIAPFKIAVKQPETIMQQPTIDFQETAKRFNKELSEMGTDFFNKIGDIQEQINKIYTEVFNLKNLPKQEIDEEVIIRKILQKIPVTQVTSQSNLSVSKDEIIKEVLSRVPKMSGAVTYEIAPQEKIKKDFLQETKDKILSDIQSLSEDAKRLLKYLEAKSQGAKSLELEEKCYFMKHSGSSSNKVSKSSIELRGIGVAKKDTAGWHRGILKDRIKEYLGNHDATEQEIELVYSHILVNLLNENDTQMTRK